MKQNQNNNSKFRLRDEKGRFVTKIFQEHITRALAAQKGFDNFKGEGRAKKQKKVSEIRKEADITPKELFTFYKSNEEIFLDMLENSSIKQLPRNSNQLEKDIDHYKGEIMLNGEMVSDTKAKFELLKFKQLLSSEINVVDFTITPEIKFDGTMILNIPNADKLLEELLEYFGVENAKELDEFTGAEITAALKEILDQELGEDEITIYAS
jgi:hypothetical protein